jgi:hypothetical protein
MLVNAGAMSTIKIAMMAMTTNNSSSVKAKRSRSFGNVKALRRSRCEVEIKKWEVENLETGERKRETGARKLDSNVKALRRSRCLSVKTRRVGNGDTNLRVQYSMEIVNLKAFAFVRQLPDYGVPSRRQKTGLSREISENRVIRGL